MKKYTIGLDVGGTKIAAGAVDSRGKIAKKIIIPTESCQGEKIILKNILKAASKVWLPGVRAIGVGMAGQCDARRGIFATGPNFPKNFKNVNIKKFLQKNFRVPVFLDNDARAFTLAESTFGAGRGYKNVVGLTLGTGIGGGIVIDGKILRGKNNIAGEIGHMVIDASSPFRCGCGKFGHFEALASGTALVNFYKKVNGKKISALEIEKKYLKGENDAKKSFSFVSKNLGLGLANIAQTLDPEIIILGGGFSNASDLLQSALREFKKALTYKSIQGVKIVRTKLGGEAGIVGAALLAVNILNN